MNTFRVIIIYILGAIFVIVGMMERGYSGAVGGLILIGIAHLSEYLSVIEKKLDILIEKKDE